MSRVLGFWLAVLLVFSGSAMIWIMGRTGRNAPVTAPVTLAQPQIKSFEFLDQLGQRFNSNSLSGKVWVGSFFFTACPSICYQQNQKLQQLHAKYAESGLQILSITCDPANDTPVALAGYASRFNADPATWKFLTPPDADMNYVRLVGNGYFGVAIDEETHTDRVILFDRQGKQQGAFSVLKPEQFQELDRLIDQLLEAEVETVTDSKPSDGLLSR